jgi:hypothetical protein
LVWGDVVVRSLDLEENGDVLDVFIDVDYVNEFEVNVYEGNGK